MNKFVHVVAAVIIKDGRFLCAQRGNTKYQAYKWEFPGGKVESGEQLETALMREIKEELDCRISIKNYLLTTEHNEIRWLESYKLSDLNWAEADLPIVSYLEKT